MRSKPISCPNCNNPETDYIARREGYVCAKCNHFFKLHKPSASSESLRIFLSYGHDDKAHIALKIKEELQAKGHEVWYDLERLKCGKDWEEYIQKGFDWVAEAGTRARFVLLMSLHSVRRPGGYCLNELARALKKQIPIFPVMIEECEPPLSICRIQWLDLQYGHHQGNISGKFVDKMRELIHALEDNKNDFEGVLVNLRTILDPIPFEAWTLSHIRRFVGREWVKDKIDRWLANEKTDKIFWITGNPGSGKSALASWLQYYHPNIKAFFLCKAPSSTSQGIYEPGDPRWCVRTIAFHLSALLPDYKERLNQLNNLERIVKENSAESMFERLISEPLHSICFPDEQKAIILIDGLDEITNESRNELASFLVRQLPKTPPWLRAIITSRYEEPLISDLQRYKPFEIDKEKTDNEKDLRFFIEKEFNHYAVDGHFSTDIVDKLLMKSEGNFLYLEQLRDALEKGYFSIENVDKFPHGLGEFYKYFFKKKFPDLQRYRNSLYDKLAIVFAVSSPLRWSEAESLFCWQRGHEIKEFKNMLGSLFNYENRQIKPFHQSLIEWITDEQKAGDYWIRLQDGYAQLTQIGYAAYEKKNATLNAGELKCIRELPNYLLALEEFDKLMNFLTDIDIFLIYFADDIYSYIGYWNELCRQDKTKRLKLLDSPRLLSNNFETWKVSNEKNHEISKVCYSIGRIFLELNAWEDAARMFKIALSFLSADCDDATKARLYNETGEACFRANDITGAEQYYGKALEIRRKLYTAHPDLAESINNYGHIFFHRGGYEESVKYYKEALTMWRSLTNGPHSGEADSLNNIALCLDNMGKIEEAEITFKQCTNVLDKVSAVNCWIPIDRRNCGDFLKRIGKLVEAEQQYKLAYDFSLRVYGPEHSSTTESAIKLLSLYINTGRQQDAMSLYSEVSETCERVYGKYHSKTIHTLSLLAEELSYAGKFSEAKDILVDLIKRIDNTDKHDKEVDAQTFHNMGAVCYRTKDFDEGMKYLKKTIEMREELYPTGHEFIWRTYNFAIETCIQKSDYSEAVTLVEKYHNKHTPSLAVESSLYYTVTHVLGRVLRIANNWKEAEKIYREIIKNGEILWKNIGEKPANNDSRVFYLAVAYNEIAFYLYVPNKNWKEAKEYYSRAIELMKTQNNEIDLANMELNLCTVLHKSGEDVNINEVKRLTEILEKTKDPRAQKGKIILQERGLSADSAHIQ